MSYIPEGSRPLADFQGRLGPEQKIVKAISQPLEEEFGLKFRSRHFGAMRDFDIIIIGCDMGGKIYTMQYRPERLQTMTQKEFDDDQANMIKQLICHSVDEMFEYNKEDENTMEKMVNELLAAI